MGLVLTANDRKRDMRKIEFSLLKNKKISAVCGIIILLAVGFQNCAKVNFDQSSLSSSGITAATSSSFSMLVTGSGITPAGVNSFTAIPGQTYDFKLSGAGDALISGLDNPNSSMQLVSGQCSGNSKYQPFTLDLTQSGAEFQFGDNSFIYSSKMADSIGGCTWKVCALDKSGDAPACVTLIAAMNSTTTTTTLPLPTTTTMKVVTTTLPPVTTTTVKVTATTTTTTLPPTTTTTMKVVTTTTLPPVTTTTVKVTTTTTTTTLPPPTTTLPPARPVVTGKTCVGPINGSYNCNSFASGGSASANNLQRDPGCNAQATITYKGQSASANAFGTGAPYNAGGGIGQGNATVTIQGVAFHVYVEDEYFINPTGNFVSCSALVSWPNFPNAP